MATNGGWTEEVRELTSQLAEIPAVQARRPATLDEKPAAALAHALVNIEEECRAYIDHSLPRLRAASSPHERERALADVREGLSRIVDAVRHAAYLRDVLD